MQLGCQLSQFLGSQIKELLTLTEVFVDAFFFIAIRQFLRQITQCFSAKNTTASDFRILLHGLRIVQPAQQRGFSVAFLADEHRFVAGIQTECEIIQDGTQVFFMINTEFLNLQHRHSPLEQKIRLRCRRRIMPKRIQNDAEIRQRSPSANECKANRTAIKLPLSSVFFYQIRLFAHFLTLHSGGCAFRLFCFHYR